ncbi:MAG: TetR/AcrR family transcriptional regulator [Deltaproteobacteria bacterium]|jgi:AcrR family transcriptional regulator|nr:TetR/AcrR family transcriptional regulator [Deltaproteobacteria bacterium]
MKNGKPSRKEREYLRHRQEILKVALKLFSEKGFHNVSMHEIAEKSEFAVGTLYKFFSNKEDLYRALMLEASNVFHSSLMAALATSGSELEKIRACVEAKIKVFMDNLDYVRLYMAETQGVSFNVKTSLDPEIMDRYEKFLKQLARVFENGIKKRLFKKFEPYLLAVALDGISNALLFHHVEYPGAHSFDADLIINIFFQQVYEKEDLRDE